MNRRDFLIRSGGITASLLLGGCDSFFRRAISVPPVQLGLIDVHSHLFNGSDLPTVRFIKIVVLEHYPKQAIRALESKMPTRWMG